MADFMQSITHKTPIKNYLPSLELWMSSHNSKHGGMVYNIYYMFFNIQDIFIVLEKTSEVNT